MGSVGAPVVRRIVEVSLGPTSRERLLADVGLPVDPGEQPWEGESVGEDAYYGLIERVVEGGDAALPFRYAEAVRADDFGALGLAMKAAPTLGDALARLARYILVLSDTLEYRLDAVDRGAAFVLVGRPHHRAGAAIANECALAAVTSIARDSLGAELRPLEVTFQHPEPTDTAPHRGYFGCEVRFGAPLDAVCFARADLDRPMPLADDGLSSYLLSRLDQLRDGLAERSLVDQVRGTIADCLPDGQPSKSRVARRIGMSERTLHRRLAEEDATFQDLVTEVRHEAARTLLRSGGHNLVEVAFLTGFSDQSAFTRAFRRWSGQTPAAFRQAADRASERATD